MGLDCSLLLKREDNAILEIDLDRFYAFDDVRLTNSFIPVANLLQNLEDAINLNDDATDSKYECYWKGFVCGILNNIPSDYNIIQAGIFDENNPIISQVYRNRKLQNRKDGEFVKP